MNMNDPVPSTLPEGGYQRWEKDLYEDFYNVPVDLKLWFFKQNGVPKDLAHVYSSLLLTSAEYEHEDEACDMIPQDENKDEGPNVTPDGGSQPAASTEVILALVGILITMIFGITQCSR